MDYRLSAMDLKFYALKAKIPTSASGCKDRKIDQPCARFFQILIATICDGNHTIVNADFLYLPCN